MAFGLLIMLEEKGCDGKLLAMFVSVVTEVAFWFTSMFLALF